MALNFDRPAAFLTFFSYILLLFLWLGSLLSFLARPGVDEVNFD